MYHSHYRQEPLLQPYWLNPAVAHIVTPFWLAVADEAGVDAEDPPTQPLSIPMYDCWDLVCTLPPITLAEPVTEKDPEQPLPEQPSPLTLNDLVADAWAPFAKQIDAPPKLIE